MYVVIATGGKQYKVKEGDLIRVEQLIADKDGKVQFDKILLLTDGKNVTVGNPHIKGCIVSGEIAGQGRHKKIEIIKFRRRKHHMKHQGHRQNFTEVKITKISN